MLEGVEALFRTMPSTIQNVDHHTNASWLASNEAALSADKRGVIAAMDRFEVLFEALNQLLA